MIAPKPAWNKGSDVYLYINIYIYSLYSSFWGNRPKCSPSAPFDRTPRDIKKVWATPCAINYKCYKKSTKSFKYNDLYDTSKTITIIEKRYKKPVYRAAL